MLQSKSNGWRKTQSNKTGRVHLVAVVQSCWSMTGGMAMAMGLCVTPSSHTSKCINTPLRVTGIATRVGHDPTGQKGCLKQAKGALHCSARTFALPLPHPEEKSKDTLADMIYGGR